MKNLDKQNRSQTNHIMEPNKEKKSFYLLSQDHLQDLDQLIIALQHFFLDIYSNNEIEINCSHNIRKKND